MPLPIRPQLRNGLYASQCQQPRDAIGLQPGYGVIIIVAPMEMPGQAGHDDGVGIVRWIHPFDAYDRKAERGGDGCDGAMKLRREGMRRIDQQTDIVFLAEGLHGSRIERAGDMLSVLALDLLQVAARRVPIRRSRRIGHPDGEASFRRSAKNQDHGRNRCLNSWA